MVCIAMILLYITSQDVKGPLQLAEKVQFSMTRPLLELIRTVQCKLSGPPITRKRPVLGKRLCRPVFTCNRSSELDGGHEQT